jgi:hypothetical protein
MTTDLKDAMASAVFQEVFANPDQYPQTIAATDLEPKEYAKIGIRDNKAALELAAKEGLSVVYPKSNELQVDVDNDQSYLFFIKQRDTLGWMLGIESITENPSKSGLPRRHITVRLKKSVTALERLCLQACLGSDRVRETLGYARHKNGESNPTLFFEKRETECPTQNRPSLWEMLKRRLGR